MATPSTHTIDLGLGFFLDIDIASSTEIDWDLRWKQLQVADGSVSLNAPSNPTKVDTDLVRGELEVTLDPSSGVVGCIVELEVIEPGVEPPAWRKVIDHTFTDLAKIDPTLGKVAGADKVVLPPVVGFGPNGASSGGSVTRFHISDEPRLLAGVGSIVKQRLFPDTPPLTLNIVAYCGSPVGPADGPGTYADPTSPWFNVFYGAYQMDCAKADGWTRPFGYESFAGVDSVVHGEDIARIGKSDWNWFSNYLYGVPEDVCEKYSTVDMSKVHFGQTITVTIGSSQWHEVTMSGVEVASAYESNAPGARQLVENSVLTNEWRKSFGLPCPRPGYTTSFIPTVLQSALLMACSEDAEGFHTLMFGGTALSGGPAGFLDKQMASVTAAIKGQFPGAGFPLR